MSTKNEEVLTLEEAKEKGLHTHSYQNGDGEYQDIDGYYHFFKGGEELLPEVKKLDIFSYSNGDGEYQDNDGYGHLFRDGEEVLPNVKKIYIYAFLNGDGKYEDTDGYQHLIRGEKELLPEIRKKSIKSYDNGDGGYKDNDGYGHIFKDGEELLPEVKKLGVISYENGDGGYKDQKEIGYLIRDGKEIAKGGYVDSYDNGDYAYEDEDGTYHQVEVDLIPETTKTIIMNFGNALRQHADEILIDRLIEEDFNDNNFDVMKIVSTPSTLDGKVLLDLSICEEVRGHSEKYIDIEVYFSEGKDKIEVCFIHNYSEEQCDSSIFIEIGDYDNLGEILDEAMDEVGSMY